MKARRTPWWYYPIALLAGLVGGVGLVKFDEATGFELIGAPWIVAAALLLLGIVILVLALQIHRYVTTDPAKRRGFIDPVKATYTLVLTKALGIAGAALTGWYAGQIIMSLSHADAPFYERAIIECAVTGGVCLIDMVIGIVGEWLCQLPPSEGPENPKIRELQRRRSMAGQPTQKTMHQTDHASDH